MPFLQDWSIGGVAVGFERDSFRTALLRLLLGGRRDCMGDWVLVLAQIVL